LGDYCNTQGLQDTLFETDMRDVSIIGIGQTPVAEHWEKSLKDLAAEAIRAAINDAHVERVDALYVGNMCSGTLNGQEHLGAFISDWVGLRGVEAFKVEAACGSGAAALRLGYVAVAGELADCVVVAGVEKMTDRPSAQVTAALAMASDGDFEAQNGLSFVALNALLMRRYMHEYGVCHGDFAPFAINAHKNAMGNPNALFPHAVTAEDFCTAKMIADPVNLLDSSPVCDGAAAVVLCSTELARSFAARPVRIRASAAATDTIALHDRRDLLGLEAATLSANKAYKQAKVKPSDIDLFELHDAFTIMSVLSLEACGFAPRGRGVRLGTEGDITIGGQIPITTMGGLKARGHPVGATGIYQVIEVAQQLREQAGANQVRDARLGMAQNIGGSGATVVTTILEAAD
jgi:acetyl-CoA C-acetyltransferase